MAGKRAEETESKGKGQQQHDQHADALRADAYTPPLNHRVMNSDGTVQPGKPMAAPKLNELTIDVDHVKIYDTPRRDATPAEKAAAAHREMPVSNEHFRDLVKQGSEFIQANSGNFNLSMKNALEEAHQTDKFANNGNHHNMDQMLKWINADLSGSFYTLRRHGDKIQVFDTHYSDTKAQGTYDLNKRAWDK
jgi:hypothetical protein